MLARLAHALALAAAALLALPAQAAFETRARAAWVYDQTTGTVLLAKNADAAIPPASMSKIMTLYMLFEALRDGRVTMDTQFSVSERAKAMGGSTMFLDTTDRPTVEQLIQGIIVQSGNDACVVVAENLAGTEEAFARLMTERGRAIGLKASTFANASGWPDPNHRMSTRDLGIVAVRLIEDFPEYYGYFGMTEYGFDGRAPQNHRNRNPILGRIEGADGLKTGHTTEAGYGLVGSAKQGGRRIVFVISGLASETERAEEAERIANWAFRQFVERTVATPATAVAEAEVWMGTQARVGLVPKEDVRLLLPAVLEGSVTARAIYDGPVAAPIAAGQELGTLVIEVEGMEPRRVPLVAQADVGRGGFVTRLRSAAAALAGQVAGEAAILR
ncbi:MAG: D-alanyl-D-alanine carboxypeptidase [Rhodobacteraceae bacterium]|nr:D-alanyl-D-alanine carboxypeptidase [Paracoccaceae bacterium]